MNCVLFILICICCLIRGIIGRDYFMAREDAPHERLADRLAKFLIKLNNGLHLDVKVLAEEFGVSERTIARDIVRLKSAHLPLEQDSQQKYYIEPKHFGLFKADDIKVFAERSGVKKLYPSFGVPFLNDLLTDHKQMVYEAKGYSYEDVSQLGSLITDLSKAIEKNRQVCFLYKNTDRIVEPYRLIHHHGSWYLAGVHERKLRTYRLSRIQKSFAPYEQAVFTPDSNILKQLEDENSIWFGQEKNEVIVNIQANVATYFKHRQLLPEQKVIDELNDGGLLVSCKISHPMQLLPLVKFWIPHVRIVSPEHLQSELDGELRYYLAG